MSQAFLPAKSYFALEGQKKTTLSILLDDATTLDPYKLQVPGNHTPPDVSKLATRIYTYTDAHLDLIPSTLDLMYVALGQATTQTKPIEERFEKFIAQCRSQYDVVFIDCILQARCLRRHHYVTPGHVLIPVVPQRYAQRGIGLMMNFIAAKSAGESSLKRTSYSAQLHVTGPQFKRPKFERTRSMHRIAPDNGLKKYKVFSEPEGGLGFVWVSGKPYSTGGVGKLVRVAGELFTRTGA